MKNDRESHGLLEENVSMNKNRCIRRGYFMLNIGSWCSNECIALVGL